jgi:predicted unusual protein kinase regulating ubiquinone biosynthesis (AarF/ABC1/UbiB family)
VSTRVPEPPPALRSLVETATALIRRSASGRIALARAAPAVPPDALPAALAERVIPRLETARAQALAPLPFATVEKVLRDAWGKPAGRVLDELDPEPLAVTAVSQVHQGELDGELVAVKVRRPGLATAVRNDLALLDALMAPLGGLLGSAEVGQLLREVREAALDELDLEHESGQQRQARRALRELADVVVPSVHSELASDDVMVSELLAGPTLEEAPPDDPARVARALVAAHVTVWRRTGTVLTDPRPGHVVLLSEGRVGLLGTGVGRPVGRERVEPALAGVRALRHGDRSGFASAARELGVLRGAAAEEAFGHAQETLGHLLGGPARLDGAALALAGEKALERLGPLVSLAGQATPQGHDLPPVRMFGQLAALLSRLGVEEDWAELVADG